MMDEDLLHLEGIDELLRAQPVRVMLAFIKVVDRAGTRATGISENGEDPAGHSAPPYSTSAPEWTGWRYQPAASPPDEPGIRSQMTGYKHTFRKRIADGT